MKNLTFSTFLTSNLSISPSDLTPVLSQAKALEVKKDEFLLQEGEKCKYSFYVEKGLLRQYMLDTKGKEHIISFGPEGWIISDRESVFFNQPSKFFIQALEDCTIKLIDDSLVRLISEKVPSFVDFNTRLLHNHIRALQNRIIQLMSYTAEERYQEFIALYPDIMLRVPQTMVASYLGIAPESLSRVRKDLANKNFNKKHTSYLT